MLILYILLLFAGIGAFLLSFVAQYRFASILRQRYPDQWKIIAVPDEGKPSGVRTWMRLQHVLRSEAPHLFEDAQLSAWQRRWRIAPRIGWICWFAAIAIRWFAAH
ncbi:hypothetical protein EC912_101124 [Luteibacter rhizovicinus]|uniref:Uncharacterized protein n=1 Tax=Luteibacter rhizovicinus TaxID=242606 RepID=A0A4V2W4W7_9GAMM|nr:hypothetical protein [Luteibacter rhizovicinus]TCV97129.1 hypothetical protein EC912_101124 [Luteibacter rhizovicinus]